MCRRSNSMTQNICSSIYNYIWKIFPSENYYDNILTKWFSALWITHIKGSISCERVSVCVCAFIAHVYYTRDVVVHSSTPRCFPPASNKNHHHPFHCYVPSLSLWLSLSCSRTHMLNAVFIAVIHLRIFIILTGPPCMCALCSFLISISVYLKNSLIKYYVDLIHNFISH